VPARHRTLPQATGIEPGECTQLDDLHRLLRANQLRHVRGDTLVVLVWHMPFHALSYGDDELTTFWRGWCEGHGVVYGALQRVTPGGNPMPLLLTPAACDLELAGAAPTPVEVSTLT
jgi:hypothetical protein